jgi:hypothetical protein
VKEVSVSKRIENYDVNVLPGHWLGTGLLFRGNSCGGIFCLFIFNPRFCVAEFILARQQQFIANLRAGFSVRFGLLWFGFLFELLREIDNVSHKNAYYSLSWVVRALFADHLRTGPVRSQNRTLSNCLGANPCRFSTRFVAKLGFRFQGKIGLDFGKGEAKAV